VAKWRVVKTAGCAGTGRLVHTSIDSDATGIRIDPDRTGTAIELISNDKLVESGVGHYHTDDSKSVWATEHVWPVEVCIEVTCAMLQAGSPEGPPGISFVNSDTRGIVTVRVDYSIMRGDIARLTH
jgi:hypothetical protein